MQSTSNKKHFKKLEFYITNVCNLTCERCNRYNNFDFTGWQRWSDYEEAYTKWGSRISVESPVILGGEPLLNPSICDWVRGLNAIWKQPVQILSNGTRIDKTSGLYDVLTEKYGMNWLGISWHQPYAIDKLECQIKNFLKGSITAFRKGDDGNRMNADLWWQDSNGVTVWLWIADRFSASSIIPGKNGNLTLYQNPADQAHAKCGFVAHKSYHMIRGKLYKCGPVALLPEFDQQYPLDISDEDRRLLSQYQPLSVEDYDHRSEDFFATLDDPIPQCKFCPIDPENGPLVSREKKIIRQSI